MTKVGAGITRRQMCAVMSSAAAAAILASLPGCGGGGTGEEAESKTTTGFASDTEVSSDPVTVYVVADENLKREFTTSDGLGRLEEYFPRYQEQAGREQVTFAVKYKSAKELKKMAKKGYDEGTIVIALEDTVDTACDKGTLDGGQAKTSVRIFSSQLYETLMVIRAADSKVKMPKADTLSGEDSEDGKISRMQNLHKFKGKIAVAADYLTEGMLANRVLARWGYYSDESGVGGEYSDNIADKIRVYKSTDKLVAAVADGTCGIGFGLQSMLWGDYPDVEQLYQPAFGNIVYSGASLPDADNAGVGRDFMEFVINCV